MTIPFYIGPFKLATNGDRFGRDRAGGISPYIYTCHLLERLVGRAIYKGWEYGARGVALSSSSDLAHVHGKGGRGKRGQVKAAGESHVYDVRSL